MSNELKENKVQMLDTQFPMCSYQITGFFGEKGKGKTTLMFKMCDEIIRISGLTKYDLENPLINNGSITHYFFISPSIVSDNTMKKQKQNGVMRTDIELTDENIDTIYEVIRGMRDRIVPTLELQDELRKFLKQEQTKELLQYLLKDRTQLNRQPLIKILKETILKIEQNKIDYPELQIKETNKTVLENCQSLYQLFSLGQWDRNFLRLQKIILNFDDSTTSTKFTEMRNSPVLKLITQARHLNVFSLNIVMHSISGSYSIFKDQNNVFVLYQGMKKEQLEKLFYDINLQTNNFKVNDFVEMYNKNMGVILDEYEDQEKYNYNYIYIMKSPKKQIWLNMEKKLK